MRLPPDRRRTRLEHALNHALKDHVNVIPLIKNTKLPALKNWPAMGTKDEKTLLAWWKRDDFNIGIVGGSTKLIDGVVHYLLIVDYDMKPGQLGHEALLDHERRGLANTRTIKTPNGVHKVWWSKTLFANSQGKLAPNVDVRCRHGYVVAAGSTIEDSDYVTTDPREIAIFPDELAALLTSKVNGHSQTHDRRPIGELDQPHAIQLVIDYLHGHAPQALQGQHGDATTYQVAAHCKDLGVSEETCLELMLEHWNDTKASPSWPYDSLRTKVTNAYRYGQNAPGSVDPRNEFELIDGPILTKDPKDQGNSPNTSRPGREPMRDESFDSAADAALDNQANPLIEGLLGQNEISAIYGYPESGKTFVALDICHAIATGTPWNGHKVTQGAVLYVAAEGGPTIRKRFRALRTKHGQKDVPLRLLRYAIDMRTGSYDADRLSALVLQRSKDIGQPIRLVVIDTLSEALAGGNDTEHMNLFIHNAKIVKIKTGANVLVIHHPGKDQSRGPRGSSAFRGWVDTLIEVHDPSQGRKNGRRKFTVLRLRDDELPALPLWFRLEVVSLGKTKEGREITSAVAVWCDDAGDEFELEMTPGELVLFQAIGRWAKTEEKDRDEVSATPLLEWLGRHEPGNKLAKMTDAAMRKAISRLRQSGYLALEDGGANSEQTDEKA